MTDSMHPPADPIRLAELIGKDRPLSHVRDMDHPTAPVRLIRLTPPNAAKWCYATSIGMYEFDGPEVPTPIRTQDGGWVCGPWLAALMPRKG